MVTTKNSADPKDLSSTTNQNLEASSTNLSYNEIKPRVISRQVLKALGQKDPLYQAAGIIALKRGLLSIKE